MKLPPDIHFRLISVDEAFVLAPDILSADEKERFEGFGSLKRRLEFTAGRVVARLLLAEQIGVPPADVILTPLPEGGVDVPGEHHLFVSITHAADYAAAAVGNRPVGIDLEPIRPRHPDLGRFLLHERESDLVPSLNLDRDQALILLWTLKEATLKARRSGFRLSPKNLHVEVDLPACTAQVVVTGGETWEATFEERDGYYLSLAFRDGE